MIANRGTLEAPRWVRTEVEAFRKHHPRRPIIPISIGGALQDAALAEAVRLFAEHRVLADGDRTVIFR